MSYNIPKNRTQLKDTGIGIITQNLEFVAFGTQTALTTQRIQFVLVGLLKGDVISNIHVFTNIISTGASANCFGAIYDTARNRLAVSTDQTTLLDSLGMKSIPISYTITQDGAYYLAFLVVNTGTPPSIMRSSNQAPCSVAVGSGVNNYYQQSSQTTMPTTASFTVSNIGFWIACS